MNPNRFAQFRITFATLTTLLAVFPAHAAAQTPNNRVALSAKLAPQHSNTPTIEVYSRETIVDITVTDAKGQPVHGLKQADFIVQQDGKPQSIRSFQEFANGTPATSPKLPPNIYTNFQPATGPLNILLLDDIYGGDEGRVRLEAAQFIKTMAPGTRLALVAMGERLTILQEPTTDQARLLKVVMTIVAPFETGGGDCPGVAMNHAVIDQLNELAKYLSGIKGRKNLIWINRGIPTLMFPPAHHGGSTPNGAPAIGADGLCPWFTASLNKTYDLLADAQVTTYPLDPSGVGHTGIGHLALDALAENTGGVAFYGDNFLDDLTVKAVDAGASYYTLSYIPPGVQYDGRYHAIGIKSNRPGVRLLYRNGYNADGKPENPNRRLLPTSPARDLLAEAVAPTAPPATQLLFYVRVEPVPKSETAGDPPVMGYLDPNLKKKPQQLTRYEVIFMLPKNQITFATDGDGKHYGMIKFDLAAFDSDNNMVTSISRSWPLPLTNKKYQQFIASPFPFSQQLDLPPGKFTLRIGILDTVSKKIGSLEIPLKVGRKPPTVASGSAP